MENFKAVILAAFLFTLLFNTKSRGQDKTARIVNSLNEVIVPIKTMNPDSSFSDLDFLKQTLENRDIVSLGEATHGTKEFFLYKVRLTQFLVSELGFKAIAFESDFSAVQLLDDFINNKVEEIDRGFGGFPLTQETRDMLFWLRKYNQTQTIQNRVHLYGLEARGFSGISASILHSFNNLTAESKALLTRIRDTRYNALNKKDIKAVKSIIPQLYQEADLNKISLNRHYITLLDQAVNHYLDRNSGKRDEFMADNVTWLQENTNAEKVIIWAHNGHLSKSPLFGAPSMGTHLYRKFKFRYFVIATAFNQGSVSISVPKNGKIDWINKFFPAVTSKNNYEYYFQQCKFPNFMIEISSLNDHEVLTPFFSQNIVMRMVGATGGLLNNKLSILKNFDLIVFFNSTNPG